MSYQERLGMIEYYGDDPDEREKQLNEVALLIQQCKEWEKKERTRYEGLRLEAEKKAQARAALYFKLFK